MHTMCTILGMKFMKIQTNLISVFISGASEWQPYMLILEFLPYVLESLQI